EEDDPVSAAAAMCLMAEVRFLAGEGLDIELLDRAVALEDRLDVPVHLRPSSERAAALGFAGKLRDSTEAFGRVLAQTELHGDWTGRAPTLRGLAWADYCAGRFTSALGYIESAVRTMEELGQEGTWYVLSALALILVAVGRPEAAETWQRVFAI